MKVSKVQMKASLMEPASSPMLESKISKPPLDRLGSDNSDAISVTSHPVVDALWKGIGTADLRRLCNDRYSGFY